MKEILKTYKCAVASKMFSPSCIKKLLLLMIEIKKKIIFIFIFSFAVVNMKMKNGEGQERFKLVMVMWAPDTATAKVKMTAASSSKALRSKFGKCNAFRWDSRKIFRQKHQWCSYQVVEVGWRLLLDWRSKSYTKWKARVCFRRWRQSWWQWSRWRVKK